MFKKEEIIKCPYCGEFFCHSLKETKYFTYKSSDLYRPNKDLYIASHNKCGEFIAQGIDSNIISDLSNNNFKINDDMTCALFDNTNSKIDYLKRKYFRDIFDLVMKYFDKYYHKGGVYEYELLILEKLKEENKQDLFEVLNDAYVLKKMINFVNIISQIFAHQVILHIYSEPLTDDVKDKLTFDYTMCY